MRNVEIYDLWRLDEPVDGSGLNVAENAEFLAHGVPPKVAAMLVAELRNVLIPLFSRLEGLPGAQKKVQRLHALADALEDVARSGE